MSKKDKKIYFCLMIFLIIISASLGVFYKFVIEKNHKVINYKDVLKEYLINDKINSYDYNYIVHFYGHNHIYEGTHNKIINDDGAIFILDKGKYSGEKKISYQIEGIDTCYDIGTKKEIDNVFYNVPIRVIEFEKIYNTIEKDEIICSMENDYIDCKNTDEKNYLKYSFKIEDKHITDISIEEKSDNVLNTARLTYKNINNAKKLESLFK